MCAESKFRRADEAANVFHNEQIELRKIELVERALEHDGVEVTFAAGVDLNGGLGARRRGAVGVERGGDVAVHHGHPHPGGKTREGLFDQRGLPGSGRGHQVDGEDSSGVEADAVVLRDAIVGAEDVFYDGDTLRYVAFSGGGLGTPRQEQAGLLDRRRLLHVYRFNKKLLARDDLRADAAAIGTDDLFSVGAIFFEAGHTLKFSGDTFEVERCPLRRRAFGDHVPIELDRVVHEAGELTNDKVNVGDTLRPGFLCVTKRDLEDGLGGGQFVHG